MPLAAYSWVSFPPAAAKRSSRSSRPRGFDRPLAYWYARKTSPGAKPDPEPYRVAFGRLRRLDPGVRPADCLVYEDSDAGAAAAVAAGMGVQRVSAPGELASLLEDGQLR